MNGLIALAAFQLFLVLCLLAIVSRFVGMLRAGAPLVSFKSPFKASIPQGDRVKVRPAESASDKGPHVVSFKLPIPRSRKAKTSEAPVDQPASQPHLGRSRKLLTLSELESVDNRAAAHFPQDYYSEIESQLEANFQAYVAEEISLADYLERVRKQHALTQAALRSDFVVRDLRLRDEAQRAAAAIEWCLDWATNQLESGSAELAA